jgi:chromate transporter
MSVPLTTLLASFGRIGLLSFGGPAAQIAVMHGELVERRQWLTERQFLDALGFCMLLPGPEAMQLATFAGWRLRGWLGGIVAGLLFVLPGAIVIAALALIYVSYGSVPAVRAMFIGVQAAVIAIVAQALLRLGRRALTGLEGWALAGIAFAAIYFFQAPFPFIVLGAALWGLARGGDTSHAEESAPKATGLVWTVVVWLAIWLAPLGALTVFSPGLLADLAWFFSRLAVVTFGGAYAVLAYMAQEVVTARGWISAGEMIDALGLAETTPGPLILVTQFVGMVAGHAEGGVPGAAAAGIVTLWATFVPCFLWIFVGAPYVAWAASQPRLNGALKAITAAIVGVILNLALWFALHVLWSEVGSLSIGPASAPWPQAGSFRPVSLGLCLLSGLLLFGLRWSIPAVLGAAALVSLAVGSG